MQHHKPNRKPLSIGPIAGRERAGEASILLSIPLELQGEWHNSGDDGEQLLSTVSGNLAATIEEKLIENGRYQPKDDCRMDSPVELVPLDNENIMIVRVTCSDVVEARMIAELVKADPEIKRYCQTKETLELRT